MDSLYLCAQPNVWYGVARLLDFGNTFDVYNRAANGEEADGLGIMFDWAAVRNDLWHAISDYDSEATGARTQVPLRREFARP